MSTLPPGWTEASVGEFAESIQTGFASGEHNRDGRGIPHIRPMNIGRDGRLTLADLRYVEAADGHRLRRGDILFNNTNSAELVGKTTWIDVDRALAFSNHMTRVRVPAALSAEFIARQLHHLWSRGTFQLLCNNHVSQASISARTLSEQVRLNLPPPAEQTRIVTRIGQLTARTQRAKESLDAVPPLLDKLRQSILAAAFRGDLTADWRAKHPDVEPADNLLAHIRAERRARWEAAELAKLAVKGRPPTDDRWRAKYSEPSATAVADESSPPGWSLASLHELAWQAGYGTSVKCAYDGDGTPVLRIPNIARSLIDLSDTKRAIAKLDIDDDDLLAAGDFLVVRTNGSKDLIGRAAVVATEGIASYFASYLIRFRLLGDSLLWAWLALCWRSPQIRSWLEGAAATSAGQYNVSLGDLGGVMLPIPPQKELPILVRLAHEALARVDRVAEDVAKQLDALAKLEQSTLAKAFRGDLVPQDPNDEPAAALLDQVRTTHGDASATRRQRSTTSAEPAAAEPASSAAPRPVRPFVPNGPSTRAFAALWLQGPLEKDAAVRRLADHLRGAGLVSFQRLRTDGPLYAEVADTIDAAVKAGHLDRPKRGQVRACKPDATAYTADDWRHALLAVLGPSPTDREDAIRAAAEWARDNCGLEFTRLRADGHIVTGLRSALNSAIRRGEVVRHGADQIARTTEPLPKGQLSFADLSPTGRGEPR